MAVPPSFGGNAPLRAMPVPYQANTAAPIAEGLGAVGQAGEQLIEKQREKQQLEQGTSFAVGLAKLQQDTSIYATQQQQSAAPGAAGYGKAVGDYWDQGLEQLMGDVSNPHARLAAVRQAAVAGAQVKTEAASYESAAGVAKVRADTGQALDILSNLTETRATATDDPTDLQSKLTMWNDHVRGLPLPADQQTAIDRHGSAQLKQSYLRGVMARDPAQAKGLLASNFFADLDPHQREALDSAADVEIRRAAAIQAHQLELAKAATREQIQTIDAQLAAGIQVPDATLQAAQGAAAGLGDSSTAFKLADAQARNAINRQTEAWTPRQYDGRINALLGLGTKRTPAQDIELDQLQKIGPERTRQVRENPAQWASLNGAPPPAIDFADPHSIAARIQWQGRVSAMTHVPAPLLSPNEAADLRNTAQASPAGRAEVLNALGGIATVDRMGAARAAQQVLPGDPLAVRIVQLNPNDRASALRGAAARAKDKTIVDAPGSDGSKALALAKYQHDVEPALALLDPNDAHAVLDMAGNMYADWATTHGVHSFNADQFGTFLHRAIGGQVGPNGIYQGGIGYWNNAPMVLPPGVNQQRFDRLFTNVKHWAPDHYPVYANGTTMPPEALRKLVPMLRPDGRYEFHGPGGQAAYDNRHQLFTVDFEAVAKNNPQ